MWQRLYRYFATPVALAVMTSIVFVFTATEPWDPRWKFGIIVASTLILPYAGAGRVISWFRSRTKNSQSAGDQSSNEKSSFRYALIGLEAITALIFFPLWYFVASTSLEYASSSDAGFADVLARARACGVTEDQIDRVRSEVNRYIVDEQEGDSSLAQFSAQLSIATEKAHEDAEFQYLMSRRASGLNCNLDPVIAQTMQAVQ